MSGAAFGLPLHSFHLDRHYPDDRTQEKDRIERKNGETRAGPAAVVHSGSGSTKNAVNTARY